MMPVRNVIKDNIRKRVSVRNLVVREVVTNPLARNKALRNVFRYLSPVKSLFPVDTKGRKKLETFSLFVPFSLSLTGLLVHVGRIRGENWKKLNL